ncbi:MAG: hypothetical protein JWR69_3129 [Pedosphaera sp.]|nr:hypothetical protein [Pedosphaera sp.]
MGPDDADLDRWGWTISTPPPSQFLPESKDPKNGAVHGFLAVSDVSVLPDSRYCFTVLRDDGVPIATFCFDCFEGALNGARDIQKLLPHIAKVARRPKPARD